MRDLDTVDLADLVPSSVADDPQFVACIAALNGELQSVTAQIQEAVLLARIDQLSSDVLDHLAWHYSVQFYNVGGTLAQKRAAVKRAIYWRRIAGTKAAVLEAVRSLQLGVKLSEWFQYEGDPYTFVVDVEVTETPISDELFAEVERVVDVTKNARSHGQVRLASSLPTSLRFGAAANSGEDVTIYPYSPVALISEAGLRYSSMCRIIEEVTIGGYVSAIDEDGELRSDGRLFDSMELIE